MHAQEEEEMGVTEEQAYAPITYNDGSSIDFQDKTLLNLSLERELTFCRFIYDGYIYVLIDRVQRFLWRLRMLSARDLSAPVDVCVLCIPHVCSTRDMSSRL